MVLRDQNALPKERRAGAASSGSGIGGVSQESAVRAIASNRNRTRRARSRSRWRAARSCWAWAQSTPAIAAVLGPDSASMRSRALRAEARTFGWTETWLTTLGLVILSRPSDSPTRWSSAQSRCGRSMGDRGGRREWQAGGGGGAGKGGSLRAPAPAGAGGGGADGVDDELGGAGEVGLVHDFLAALGVDEDFGGRVSGADLVAVLGAEEQIGRASCRERV